MYVCVCVWLCECVCVYIYKCFQWLSRWVILYLYSSLRTLYALYSALTLYDICVLSNYEELGHYTLLFNVVLQILSSVGYHYPSVMWEIYCCTTATKCQFMRKQIPGMPTAVCHVGFYSATVLSWANPETLFNP